MRKMFAECIVSESCLFETDISYSEVVVMAKLHNHLQEKHNKTVSEKIEKVEETGKQFERLLKRN